MIVTLSSLAPAFASDTIPSPNRPFNDDEGILEVNIGNQAFDEYITFYQESGFIYLPLDALSEITGIPITVSPSEGTASGFIRKKTKNFFLDSGTNEVVIDGASLKVDPRYLKLYNNNLYVEYQTLSVWLDLGLALDLYQLKLTLHPVTPLPVQERLDREKNLNRLLKSNSAENRNLPALRETYHLASFPFFDHNLGIGQTRTNTGEVSNEFRHSLTASGDLLYMGMNLFIAGDSKNVIDKSYITLSRKDDGGGVIDKLPVSDISLGHINQPSIPMVSSTSTPQPGFLISSYPIYKNLDYDRKTFKGELSDGWDVELYRNNILIGYQQPDANYQYLFDNIPLLYGNNIFRLIFHGPKGEEIEKTETYYIGASLVPPGEHNFMLASSLDENLEKRWTARFSTGLTHGLSGNLSFVELPFDGAIRQYSNLSLSSFGYGVFGILELTKGDTGLGSNLRLKTSLGSTAITLNSFNNHNLISPLLSLDDDPIEHEDSLELSTTFDHPRSPINSASIGASKARSRSGQILHILRSRIGTGGRKISAANFLDAQFSSQQESTLSGNLIFSIRPRNFEFKGEATYKLKPETSLESMAIGADYRGFRNLLINSRFQKNLTQKQNHFKLSLNRRYNHVNTIGISAEAGSDEHYRIMLNWNYGLGYQPDKRRWITPTQRATSNGIIAPRFFLDTNNNGQFDREEELLDDAGLLVDGRLRLSHTDPGVEEATIIQGLPVYRPVAVEVAPSTLEDPLWIPRGDGYQVTMHPGSIATIDFPVVITGEIDGVVSIDSGEATRQVSSVTIEVVDTAGKVVAKGKTAFDGYYVISKIPLGEYRVHVAQEELKGLKLLPPPTAKLVIDIDEPLVSGVDFTIRQNDELRVQGDTKLSAELSTNEIEIDMVN